MMDDTENRKRVRFSHISPLQVKELKSGQMYEARMFNYSDNGIYFESDAVFRKGDKIYFGIQKSPYPNSSGTTEEKLKVGQVIELGLPLKGKTAKIIGEIARMNEEGFGLKFKKIG